MHKLIVPESMTGSTLIRTIEDHLFENENSLEGSKFFWRAKETAIHMNNDNSSGWSGHCRTKVAELAKEFGIEVEFKPNET